MFDIDEIRKQALASMRETMEKNEERISKIEVPSSEKGASVSAAEVEEQIAANTQRQVEILGQMFGPDSMAQMAVNEELLQKMVNDKVADNVFVNDVLVLPKGAEGVGKVTKVVGPRMFGQDARIDVDFGFIYAIDNTRVKVFLGDIAKQAAETVAGAAGAAIGGMVVLGPVGIIGGAFVTGKSVNIPAGSTTFVQVKADTDIQGMVYQGSN